MRATLNGKELPVNQARDGVVAFADFDRLSLFGDGVFETMFVNKRKIHLRDYHMQRLAKGLHALQLAVSTDEISSELDYLLNSLDSSSTYHRLKLVVSRGAGLSGYSTQGSQPRRFMFVQPFNFEQPGPASLRECQFRLGSQPALAGLKHCNRLEQVLAKIEQETSGFDDGLLCSQRGEVVEATSANVFILEGNTLLTPRLDDCGVDGVMRRFILHDLLPKLGMAASEELISIQRLLDSDGVLLSNSLRGVHLVGSCCSLQGAHRRFAENKLLLDLQAAVTRSMLGNG